MSQSTVVSIVPVKIEIRKSGALYPDSWDIPKADDLAPEVLVIDDAKTRVYLGVERGYFWTKILSAELANAIVRDYIQSCICTDADCFPGIFDVPNTVVTKKDVEKVCAVQLTRARLTQSNWYNRLIRAADDDWAKSGHSHRTISNLQRDIAKKMRLNKEWIFISQDDTPYGMLKCPACKQNIEKDAIICAHCNLILKPEEHKKLSFVGA
jgi:hypothetical protein